MWRFRAAKQGNINGFMKTAFCYQAGIGVSKDSSRALYWLERAAERGEGEAQMLVAKMHNKDTMADAAIAYIWYSLAYVNGYKQAKEARDEVVQQFDIDTILGVQNVANRVYKMLKQGEGLEAHSVINLLDKLYGRKGYRPTDEMLETLALGELETEMATLQPVAKGGAAVEVSPETTFPASDATETASPSAERIMDSAVGLGADSRQSHTAMSGYQQQSWQTSWDSLLAGSENKPKPKNSD